MAQRRGRRLRRNIGILGNFAFGYADVAEGIYFTLGLVIFRSLDYLTRPTIFLVILYHCSYRPTIKQTPSTPSPTSPNLTNATTTPIPPSQDAEEIKQSAKEERKPTTKSEPEGPRTAL